MPLGVDEAGKGPAVGSMFAAAVYCRSVDTLPAGIADSKQLTPDRRQQLADQLRSDDQLAIGVAEVTPSRIDDPDTDMNSLAVTAHATAIKRALTACPVSLDPPVDVHCDACDTDPDRFGARVSAACGELSSDLELTASHGADDDSRVVGAASIVAKVERDAHVAALESTYGQIGSGYPSDPTTRAFLETYVTDHGSLPACARESWSTCRDVLAAAEQTGLDQF